MWRLTNGFLEKETEEMTCTESKKKFHQENYLEKKVDFIFVHAV